MSSTQEVTREEITWLYRALLGREPESANAVDGWIGTGLPFGSIRKLFLSSSEFSAVSARAPHEAPAGSPELGPPLNVEVVLDNPLLERLLEHVACEWEKLEREEPHWSVLSDRRFMADKLVQYEKEFYLSGQAEVERLMQALNRSRRTLDSATAALELGCGVGRVTKWLAEVSNHLHAFDISSSHLELATRYLNGCKTRNVSLHRLTTCGQLAESGTIGLFFSILVLQHNPPPVARELLKAALSALEPGGIGYFQVPIYRPGYKFNTREYLSRLSKLSGIEMHLLPQHEVLNLCYACGCRPIEIWQDNYTRGTDFISNTFLVEKEIG